MSDNSRVYNCSTCVHWFYRSAAGYCRKDPPQLLPGSPRGYWPQTEATDFCSNYIEIPTANPARESLWKQEHGIPKKKSVKGSATKAVAQD